MFVRLLCGTAYRLIAAALTLAVLSFTAYLNYQLICIDADAMRSKIESVINQGRQVNNAIHSPTELESTNCLPHCMKSYSSGKDQSACLRACNM